MHYCKSLNSHPSEHVRKICTDKIAEINLLHAAEKDDPRHSVADVYSRILALLAASSTKPIDSAKGSAPMALPAHAINKAVEKVGINAANPHTEQFIAKKLAQDPKLTRGQILRELECHGCGGKGHIKSDCRKADKGGKKSGAPSSDKPAGNGGAKKGKRRPPKKSTDAFTAAVDYDAQDAEFSYDYDLNVHMMCCDVDQLNSACCDDVATIPAKVFVSSAYAASGNSAGASTSAQPPSMYLSE
jgi:hypothetical protein